jgi:subtilisin family serine protease
MKGRLFALVVLSICLVAVSAAQPDPPRLTPQHVMDKAVAEGRVAVIVELGGAASAPEHLLSNAGAVAVQRQNISLAQADVRRALRGLAHRVNHEYTSLPYMAIEASPDALRMLEAMRGVVTRIDEDIRLYMSLAESGPLVQAPTAWAAGFDGQGTVIAIIDSGVDRNHVFLSGKVVEEACFVTGGGCPNGLSTQTGPGSGVPCTGTDCFHGTHVAGIAAGLGGPPPNAAFSGIAKGANLMSVLVFDSTGSASFSDILAALQRVYDLRGTRNFAAVNMSLGLPATPFFSTCDTTQPAPALKMVIDNLRAAGIATAIASGNDGFTNAVSFPACISSAISVASNDDGSFGTTVNQVSDFSNVAPFVSLIAPGKWITSSFPPPPAANFQTIAGTSMSTPHVAGAFAVLKQASPNASVTDLLNALRNTGLSTPDVVSAQRPGAKGTVMKQIRIADALGTLGTVQFDSATYSVSESGIATITVTRAGSLAGSATVNYATSNGTALAGTHYTATSGTLTFGPGDESVAFTVSPIDNTVVNANRTVNLTLSNATGATLGSPSSAVLTINNDDNGGTIAFGAATGDVAEDGGSVAIPVVRTGTNLASGVTVQFSTLNGTALAGVGYTTTSGTLTFGSGETALTFNVPIINNTLLEGNKTFQAKLSNPLGGGTLGTPATTTITIHEDDTAGTFQFSSPAYAVTEGTALAPIAVTRTGAHLAGGIRIGYATSNGTATAGLDYTAAAGTLTFAAGVTSMTFNVSIINDVLFEPDETVNLALNVPAGSQAVLGAPANAVLTIHDNDAPKVQFSVAAQSVAEGSVASVIVTRTGGVNVPVTVDYQVAGGGTATGGGVDYTLANGTLSFAVGQISATIPVPTVNDTLFEGPETIVLQLANPTGGAVLGTPVSTTITIIDNDTPGTVQFSAAAYSVAENVASGFFDLTVTRTGTNLASGIVVNYAVIGGTATGGGIDYTLADGAITFAANQTSLPIRVQITNDILPEGNETVIVKLTSSTATIGAIGTTTLTIVDDEQALSFSAGAYSVTEGTPSIAIPVLRSGPTTTVSTVTCQTVAGGTAIVDQDYKAVSTTLTFAVGATMVNCMVPILNDTLVDGARTVNLALANPLGTGNPQLGVLKNAQLTINDNDQGGTVKFGAAAYTVAEGAVGLLTVMRTGLNLASGVTVNYAVTGGTATGGGVDYTLASGTLTFNAGITSLTIPVPTIQDTLFEGPETVIVTLSNPTGGATLGSPATTTLTITDNDTPGTVQFSAAAYSVAENVASHLFNLTVNRTGTNLASNIVVNYAVIGGTATGGGGDYTLADGAITFAANQTTASIPVQIVDDLLPDGNKTIIVKLTSSTATIGAIGTTTLTILDDEQALSFSAPAYTVNEGILSIAIPVMRTGPTPAGTTVNCQTVGGGSAVVDFDYKAVNTTLTFAAGVRSMNCTIPILNDTIVDGPRTVNLALLNPAGTGGPQLGLLNNTAVLTINDNDQGGNVRFGAAAYTVAEGAVGMLTVTRTGVNLASGVTVDYTVTGGTATGGGVDYTLANGTLTFNAGIASLTIPVPTVNDTLFEGPETVIVTLSNPTGGATLGVPASTTLTITDNDTPGTVQFSAAAYSVAENVPGGVFNLTVTRTGTNLASGIVVNYTVTGGTATGGGVDYTLADGAITFAANQTTASIPVLINNDGLAEGNETVIVTLSSPTATLGLVKTTTLTILDDEQALSFSAAAYSVTEGTASIGIPIMRTGPTPAGTTVNCQTVAGGTAIAGQDYTAVNTTLTFAAASRMVTCVVPILNDTLVDGPRAVNLALTVPPGGSGLPGAITAATLTINDNDLGGTFKFGATAYTVAEGAVGMLTVTRTGVNLGSLVTVDYAVTGGTATNGVDYNLASGTLTLNAGQTLATIQVPTVLDAVFDGSQTVIVTLSNPTSGASIGTPSSTTLTITDKTPPARVRFENDLVLCPPGLPCRAFTARLTAEEHYTWLSSSGTPSAYLNVISPTLSNFSAEAVGLGAIGIFNGSFSIASNQKYILVLTIDAGAVTLFLFGEGSVSAASESSGVASPRTLVRTIKLPTAPGLQFAPVRAMPAPIN